MSRVRENRDTIYREMSKQENQHLPIPPCKLSTLSEEHFPYRKAQETLQYIISHHDRTLSGLIHVTEDKVSLEVYIRRDKVLSKKSPRVFLIPVLDQSTEELRAKIDLLTMSLH